jgi:outer membrane protein assembly factor BamB
VRALRTVPLVVLVTLLACAVVVRLRARHGSRAGAAVTVTSSALADPPRASPWPPLRASGRDAGAPIVSPHAARMLHGDRHHTHRAHGRGPRAANVAWVAEIGGAIEAQVVASPDEQTLYVASLDGALTALGRDGKRRWRVALGDRAYATPCVADDGTIYAGSDAHRFVAIAPDGHTVFRLEVDGEVDTGCVIVASGNVVFAAGHGVYAVRPGGDVAWRFDAKGKVFTAPAITEDGLVLFGSQDHHAYALTSAGALAWATDLAADVDGAPAIGDDGAAYFGTDGDEIVRLGARGEIAWRTRVGGFVRGTLSVARDGDVLAGVYGPSPRAVRLAAADGALVGALAAVGTGAHEVGVHGGALEDDAGMLFFGAEDDDVVAVAPDGTVAWRYTTGADVDAPLTLLASGDLVAASDDGRVYLFAP